MARAAAAATRWLLEGESQPAQTLDHGAEEVYAFLGPQIHIATEHGGATCPTDLEEYLRHDGFSALERSRAMGPQAVIAEISSSGLAGRGGAGFPTGVKWESVREAPGPAKYVICNGDEGDPGAFMDRMLLESHPYRVIEGMAIAASAVGAGEGIFYIRAEYPLAVQRIREAISHCEKAGILGELKLQRGAAAWKARGVRLRRGDGDDRLTGGPARHAAAAAPLPRPARAARQADADQQCRDIRDDALDHPQRQQRRSRPSARTAARGRRSSRWPARCGAAG